MQAHAAPSTPRSRPAATFHDRLTNGLRVHDRRRDTASQYQYPRLATIAAMSLLVLAAVCASPRPAKAADMAQAQNFGWAADLTLLCGEGDSDPRFQNRRTGKMYPILDPQLKAVAEKACHPGLLGGGATAYPVNIVNARSTPLYVSYTLKTLATPTITWGIGCTVSGAGAMIAAGATCAAQVATNTVSSRFCASLTAAPANCFDAQVNHQTMVETIFEPASNPGCFNQGTCVWFDISLIPSFCTDALWEKNQCSGTGGASYNLPVTLACNSVPVYSCQGPVSTKYGTENYPANCGNPDATCVGSKSTCVNAYFYPMFDPPENAHQPNSPCLGGTTFTITFMSGQ